MFIQSIGVSGFTGSKVPGCRSWVSGLGIGTGVSASRNLG